MAGTAPQELVATHKVKQLGFVARDGQQRLRQLLEGELARYALQVPSIKTQEWTAFGTLEDCSRWVQSALKTALLNEVMERCDQADRSPDLETGGARGISPDDPMTSGRRQ